MKREPVQAALSHSVLDKNTDIRGMVVIASDGTMWDWSYNLRCWQPIAPLPQPETPGRDASARWDTLHCPDHSQVSDGRSVIMVREEDVEGGCHDELAEEVAAALNASRKPRPA